MTNQQGAPEALFYADALDRCAEVDFDHIFVPAAAELRRLHAENERLATLQAQQPAPSAAAAITDTEAFQNFHRLLCARFGYVHDERDWRRDQLSLVEHIARQAQPSPTPQADSQPAGVTLNDAIEIAKSLGVREYGPNTRNWSFEYSQLARFVAALTAPQEDSQPAQVDAMADSQYLAGVSAGWNAANADNPNEALRKLHESRAGYLKPLRAARAPADSVTAPAGGVAAGIEAAAKLLERKADDFARENGSDDLGSLFFGRGAHADAKLEYHSTLLELADDIRSLAPPAQAADSVLEDAALSSEQQRAIFEAYESAASESYFEVRPQIDCNDRRRVFKAGYERGWDAARKQGGANG